MIHADMARTSALNINTDVAVICYGLDHRGTVQRPYMHVSAANGPDNPDGVVAFVEDDYVTLKQCERSLLSYIPNTGPVCFRCVWPSFGPPLPLVSVKSFLDSCHSVIVVMQAGLNAERRYIARCLA